MEAAQGHDGSYCPHCILRMVGVQYARLFCPSVLPTSTTSKSTPDFSPFDPYGFDGMWLIDVVRLILSRSYVIQGLITNLVTGYLIGVVPAQILTILGLLSAMVGRFGNCFADCLCSHYHRLRASSSPSSICTRYIGLWRSLFVVYFPSSTLCTQSRTCKCAPPSPFTLKLSPEAFLP